MDGSPSLTQRSAASPASGELELGAVEVKKRAYVLTGFTGLRAISAWAS